VANFSKLQTDSSSFYYQKDSQSASHTFNQKGRSLYINQPRLPFEYYVEINLNDVGSAKEFTSSMFNSTEWKLLQPLVKSVEMPSMKIETSALNQYNRKRIAQTKVDFDPVTIIFHDVADGKTLRFWEMYYRYYFKDGNEPGVNVAKNSTQPSSPYGFSNDVTGRPNDLRSAVTNSSLKTTIDRNNNSQSTPASDIGSKKDILNIVEDTLENQNFGFNLEEVKDGRYLISTIDIYQTHGGRFNKVTLVNPRITAFKHDKLDYADSEKTLELTFTIDYEYAFYEIQNDLLTDTQKEIYDGSNFLELPSSTFNTKLVDFVDSNNPALSKSNSIISRIGKNLQNTIGAVARNSVTEKVIRPISSSVLGGMVNIIPLPHYPTDILPPSGRSFVQSAKNLSKSYQDLIRKPGG
jgi:hypothetical protein